MSGVYKPNFEDNISGCLGNYGDIKGAFNWFKRAENDLSNEDFIELVDKTIGTRFRCEPLFSKIFTLRDQKWLIVNGMKGVEEFLKEYRFKEAEEFFEKNKLIFDVAEYKELKQKYWGKKSIEELLKENRFEEADQYHRNNKHLLNEVEYNELKQEYWGKNVQKLKNKIIDLCPMGNQEGFYLAGLVIQYDPEMADDFSWDRLKTFIVSNMDRLDFSKSAYLILLGDIANGIMKGHSEFDENILTFIIEKALAFPYKKGMLMYENVWTVLLACRPTLNKFFLTHKRELIEIEEFYPFEKILRFASLYLPTEKSCLNYLKNWQILLDDTSYEQLKLFFKNNRYFNCSMILALLRVKKSYSKITIKDIINLLEKIVSYAFNYNLENLTPIQNLIFPRCISDHKKKNIQVPLDDFVFCEGRWRISQNGEGYMQCRNRRCDERTDILNNKYDTEIDNYFFEFLHQKFGITCNVIFSEDNFLYAMGAFNRWNEIRERVICGYGGSIGCASTLRFSKAHQVKPGSAAYATTYWRCSNPSCKQKEVTIKITHCKGCRKIIDSRFDKISCDRSDGHDFYICIDCGYCCSTHKVSGICPKCGQKKGWDVLDPYHKLYRCQACHHEIFVPGSFKDDFYDKVHRDASEIRHDVHSNNRNDFKI